MKWMVNRFLGFFPRDRKVVILTIVCLAVIVGGCVSTGAERRPTTPDEHFSPFEWSPETSDTIEPPFHHLHHRP